MSTDFFFFLSLLPSIWILPSEVVAKGLIYRQGASDTLIPLRFGQGAMLMHAQPNAKLCLIMLYNCSSLEDELVRIFYFTASFPRAGVGEIK